MLEVVKKYPIGSVVRLQSDAEDDPPRVVQGYKQIGDTKYLIFADGNLARLEMIG